MHIFYVCVFYFLCYFGKVSPLGFKKGRLGRNLRLFIIIMLIKIIGSSAYISPTGNQSICSMDLRELRFVWFEGERSMLAKGEALCLRIFKRRLRKSEQSYFPLMS